MQDLGSCHLSVLSHQSWILAWLGPHVALSVLPCHCQRGLELGGSTQSTFVFH